MLSESEKLRELDKPRTLRSTQAPTCEPTSLASKSLSKGIFFRDRQQYRTLIKKLSQKRTPEEFFEESNVSALLDDMFEE